MSRNGTGTYSLPAGNPVVTGTTISSTVQNNTMSDVATALTQSIANDGQTPITANLPMGAFRHTGVGNAVARTDYAAAGQVQDGSFIWGGTGGGTADVITLTPSPSITAYAAGQTFRFISSGANTTSVTVNVSGVGAKAVTKFGTTALAAGDIPSGAIVEITYDGTEFQLVGNLYQLLSSANTFTGSNTFTASNNFTADQTFSSSDAGAVAGPNLILFRNSASPAANDLIPQVLFRGKNSVATTINYVLLTGVIVDPANGSEDGRLDVYTTIAGVEARRASIGSGMQLGSPTGGDNGAGTLNAAGGVYVNALPAICRRAYAEDTDTGAGVSVSLGTVVAGDYIELMVNGDLIITAAVAGIVDYLVGSSGTATITNCGGAAMPAVSVTTNTAAVGTYYFGGYYILKVTVGGTLSVGIVARGVSGCTVSSNNVRVAARCTT